MKFSFSKKMKNIVIAFFAVVMVFVPFPTAFAKDDISTVERDRYPQEQVLTVLAEIFGDAINVNQINLIKKITLSENIDVKKIRAFYEQWNLPGAKYAEDIVWFSGMYDVDPYLIASFMFNETTACKFAVNNNCFGWGTDIPFDNHREGIKVVAWNIGGHNPNTARYYAGKNIEGIINTYNPVYKNPKYLHNVLWAMNEIKGQNI